MTAPRPESASATRRRDPLRSDLSLIAGLVPQGARVLDVGCGDGALLESLMLEKGVDGRGIEISQPRVSACVARGLAVIQGNAETDLPMYPDRAFDYVILSRTIQATRQPREVLNELLRIGAHVIVSFPNFGYWRIRLSLLLTGRMPRTERFEEPWYASDNIHLCSIADFTALAREMGAQIEAAIAVRGRPGDAAWPMPFTPGSGLANWLGKDAVFQLTRTGPSPDA
ncbi:MAG: methionine biosynthesis protein MetW [Alphaproteobacteria bacterium]|nr:methionine biosynthesis protein MetW [Alphaproteobacteria bacterium]